MEEEQVMFVYLGSPYSHPDEQVREARYLEAERAMVQMLKDGTHTYSPIVMTHAAAMRHSLPQESSWWRLNNYAFLGMASELRVLMIEGWHSSVGLADEINMAGLLGIPISYWRLADRNDKWEKLA
jgi:hypothetical protein